MNIALGLALVAALLYLYLNKKGTVREIGKLQKRIDDLSNQADKLQKENKDNYSYALLVQSSFQSYEDILKSGFSGYFIYYKPRALVGGDFYLVKKAGDKVIVAVADCTGYGVSGTLMSILSITCLNNILSRIELNADEVLNEFKKQITTILGPQNADGTEIKNSTDIALCIIDKEKMEMEYSGAFIPMYFISNNNLEVYRGDRIPVGYSSQADDFYTRHTIPLHEGDIIYLFTDGYYDQFGGEYRKKFMAKRFGHLLLDVYQSPMEKQKEWLDRTLLDWMGDNNQVDDITILGIKI